jgi:hypothetical protein
MLMLFSFLFPPSRQRRGVCDQPLDRWQKDVVSTNSVLVRLLLAARFPNCQSHGSSLAQASFAIAFPRYTASLTLGPLQAYTAALAFLRVFLSIRTVPELHFSTAVHATHPSLYHRQG